MSLYIGILSGTSMDGIDVAIVNPDKHHIVAAQTYSYPGSLHLEIVEIMQGGLVNATQIARLNRVLGMEFANACNHLMQEASIRPSDIAAIGSHGQTICHEPETSPACTLQLGCAHTIAQQTGITTVADFRGADIAAGGQGAPLAPLYHEVLFSKISKPLGVVNIGGIANVTWLGKQSNSLGFDTGPGNGLLDEWIRFTQNKAYDAFGTWARGGTLIPELLEELLKDPYFEKANPKSLDKNYFSLPWLHPFLKENMQAQDIQTTLTHFTAKTVAREILHLPERPETVICCGGGVHNDFLMDCLSESLSGISLQKASDFNLNSDYIEAMLFAWLAKQRMDRQTLSLMSFTGCPHKHYVGVIYQPF